MLKTLHVKNLALISDTKIEFKKGLNIISGETGAGKSLLIKSVELALGKKGDKTLIRNGEEFAQVELEFDYVPEEIKNILEEEGIEISDEILVSRKISEKKSIARINGESVNLKLLWKIVSKLIVLHGQQAAVEFRDENYHLKLLDTYASNGILEEKNIVKKAYEELMIKKRNYNDLKNKSLLPQFSRDFLEYEVQELEKANLVIGEDKKLEKRFKVMQESEKLLFAINNAYSALNSEQGISDIIGSISYEISAFEGLDSQIKEISENLTNIESIAYDTTRLLDRYKDSLLFDESEKAEIENRLNEINHLTTKYNVDVEGLLELLEDKKKTLFELDHFEDNIKKAKLEYEKANNNYFETSEVLSNKRKKISERFAKDIIKEMVDLDFSRVDMRFEFAKKSELAQDGIDDVKILVSFNVGENLKPLTEIASGGELSRVMLAVKSVLGNKGEMPTLIFDEIDSGISGHAATKVGKKMKEISQNHQLLCITHLGQIVALGDENFFISKESQDSKTTTYVKHLNEEETINEIARILSGDKISEAVLLTAKELRKK